MGILRQNLITEVKSKFPAIRKPQDYADVILEGISLKALDYSSAKRRNAFLKSKKIKDHTFTRCYTDLNLISVIKNADTNTVTSSARAGLLFSMSNALRIVTLEQKLLLEHIMLDSHVRMIVTKSLKLNSGANFNTIRNNIKQGQLFKQVDTYKKIFGDLGKNGVTPRGYRGLSIVTTPVNRYYLSPKATNIFNRCKGVI